MLRARWSALAKRERWAVALGLTFLALALVWSVLLGPALSSLQRAQAQNVLLDNTLETMQQLQRRAQALQLQVTMTREDALQLLQRGVAALGNRATLQLLGEQATVTVIGVNANALAQWMVQADATSGLRPREVHLTRDGGSTALWSGTLVFVLPGAASG